MLVKRRILMLSAAAVIAALAAFPVRAAKLIDYGAGPIKMRITPCLIADRTPGAKRCPEPQISNSPEKAKRIASHLARANFFIDLEDLDKARAETNLALAIDPNDAQALLLSARLSFTMGDVKRADDDLARARKLAPHDANAQATYAYFLDAKGSKLEALRELDEVLRRLPQHRFAHELRARLLMEFGHYRDALTDLNALIEEDPRDVVMLMRRANAFLGMGKARSAVGDLSAALQLEPNRFDLVLARAAAYAAAGLDELALRDYNALLASVDGKARYPMSGNDRAKVLAQRAFTLVHLHKFDDAADDMSAAIGIGGTPSILRAQIFLRRNGFPEVPLDGHNSPKLRKALSACFGLDACFQGVMRAI